MTTTKIERQPYILDTDLRGDLIAGISVAINRYREHEANMRDAALNGSSQIVSRDSALLAASEYARKVEVLREFLHTVHRSEIKIIPR